MLKGKTGTHQRNKTVEPEGGKEWEEPLGRPPTLPKEFTSAPHMRNTLWMVGIFSPSHGFYRPQTILSKDFLMTFQWQFKGCVILTTCSSPSLDCEQSLFSSKIRGKERKTSKRASVTVSVTWERRYCELLVAWALGDKWDCTGFIQRFERPALWWRSNSIGRSTKLWRASVSNLSKWHAAYAKGLFNRVGSFGAIWVRISDPRCVWICLDHGASKEPANPLWSWIRRFLWCTMIQADLGSLIPTRITPKERTHNVCLLRCDSNGSWHFPL